MYMCMRVCPSSETNRIHVQSYTSLLTLHLILLAETSTETAVKATNEGVVEELSSSGFNSLVDQNDVCWCLCLCLVLVGVMVCEGVHVCDLLESPCVYVCVNVCMFVCMFVCMYGHDWHCLVLQSLYLWYFTPCTRSLPSWWC